MAGAVQPDFSSLKRYPPGLQAWLLNRWAADLAFRDFKLADRYGKRADKIFGEMADRNMQGRDLEKAGHLDDAIRLYEINVTQGFDGPFPYERLRIIYLKQKAYDRAIRVCEAYDKMAKQKESLGGHGLSGAFTVWAEKIRTKRDGKGASRSTLNDTLKRWGW